MAIEGMSHLTVLAVISEIGVEPSSRPLRMRVQDLKWELEDDALWLDFSLGRGSYATVVLRELVRC